jgi:hypothetical protein
MEGKLSFRFSSTTRPSKHKIPQRIIELGQPKQTVKTNIFLHKDFRGLLHADF